MKAVILAAGKGTRMGDLTKDTPKPMLRIEGKTLLEWKIDALPAQCTEVVLVIGYLGQVIKDYFGSEYKGKKITYVEAETKGTGYALWSAKEHLDESFIVLCGDDLYTKKDIETCLQYPYAALVYKTNNPVSGGSVVVNDEGIVTDIVEGKYEGGVSLATGLYVLSPEVFSLPLVPKAPGSDEFGLPQTLLQMHPAQIKAVYTNDWYQVTSPEDLTPTPETLKSFN